MKVLFVIHQFFPHYYTGTERLVLNLSKQIQRMGHSVKVLTYGLSETEGLKPDGEFLTKEYEFQGIPVISIKHQNVPDNINFTVFDQSSEEIMKKIISQENCDVVHVLHPMRMGTAVRVAKKGNIPVVLSPTDFWLMCPKSIAVTNKGDLCQSSEKGFKCIKECFDNTWKDKILRRYEDTKEILNNADCVTSATTFLYGILKNNILNRRMKIVRFGEDYINICPNMKTYLPGSEITIGFLSTLMRHKGAHILIEAYKLAKMKNLKLKIYGHYFHEEEYYRTLVKMAQNYPGIELCGSYNYEEMPRIFSEIDMLIVPSIWWENSPLVIIGALAHNVPAIVSDLGGLTEIIRDGENGLVFEVGNVEGLTELLRKIGQHPEIINELKANIHRPPRIEEMAFEFEQIYTGLIDTRVKQSSRL
jgi:glycosyltransferase involved in cell wall biosynthesis